MAWKIRKPLSATLGSPWSGPDLSPSASWQLHGLDYWAQFLFLAGMQLLWQAALNECQITFLRCSKIASNECHKLVPTLVQMGSSWAGIVGVVLHLQHPWCAFLMKFGALRFSQLLKLLPRPHIYWLNLRKGSSCFSLCRAKKKKLRNFAFSAGLYHYKCVCLP